MFRTISGFVIIAWLVGLLAGGASAKAEDVDSLRVHVLDCGMMRAIPSDELLAEVPDAPAKIDLANRCFVVEHPKGRLLWDTGFPHSFKYTMRRIAFATMSFGRSGLSQGDELSEQLDALGLDDDDIDYLALSHSHWDHAGGANEFDDAKWIVQEKELEWAFSRRDIERPHVDPDLYAKLERSKKEVLPGTDFDVFGDGSVVVLSAPGHTPGHQCLFLDLPNAGPVVLSGDLYHTVLNREHRASPSFNTDPEQTRKSMDRIEAFTTKRGAELWIQHDPTSGPQAPALVE
jgi:N-acyl homoserine lactone hydrolase